MVMPENVFGEAHVCLSSIEMLCAHQGMCLCI